MSFSASLRLALLHAQARSGGLSKALLALPEHLTLWPLSTARGRKLVRRHFDFCGYAVEMAGPINWHVEHAGDDWQRAFFSFSWLEDVSAIRRDKVASSFAREFINAFTQISHPSQAHDCAFEPEVMGERLAHWLYARHFVLLGGSRAFHIRFQRAVVQHVHLLWQRGEAETESLGPCALKGLIVAACTLPSLAFMLPRLLEWLAALVSRDVLPDGCHRSCCPGHHMAFLKALLEIRAALQGRLEEYRSLDETIHAMSALLQALCHGDGRLGLFGANLMEDAEMISRVVNLSGGMEQEPMAYAQSSGYVSLHHEGTCLLMRLCPAGWDHLPLGVGSCELSHAAERIVVNCGAYIGSSEQWRAALQQASAFSTLSISRDAPAQLAATGVTQHVEHKSSRDVVTLRYALTPSLRHERQVELSADGSQLKGRDLVEPIEGTADAHDNAAQPVALRFHLHPDIRVQQQKEGTLLLKSLSGCVWQFSSSHMKDLRVEESVFLGYSGKPQKTLQLLIPVHTTEIGVGVRWEFRAH